MTKRVVDGLDRCICVEICSESETDQNITVEPNEVDARLTYMPWLNSIWGCRSSQPSLCNFPFEICHGHMYL